MVRVLAQERGQASVMEPAVLKRGGQGDAGNRRWHRHVDIPRWRSGRIPDCSCRRDQRRRWMVPRNVARNYNFFRLCVQQFVAVVPVIVVEVQEITQAGTGITLVLSGHSVIGRLEKWQQRQRRVVFRAYIATSG